MHRMGREASYRLLLTGTVITNKAIDVFSQYKFLNPAIYGNSFYAFRNRYFDMVGYGNHTPVLKKSMEGELTEKLHSISYRATKAECLDLPETTDVIDPQAGRCCRCPGDCHLSRTFGGLLYGAQPSGGGHCPQ